MSYESRFPWAMNIGENCIAHHDGSVSVMVSWQGINAELIDDNQVRINWLSIVNFLHAFPGKKGWTIEFHGWRERDFSLAIDYLKQKDNFIRAQDVCIPLREKMADHMAQYSFSNELAVVLTLSGKKVKATAGGYLKSVKSRAKRLLEKVDNEIRHLNKGRILRCDEFKSRIVQSMRRADFLQKRSVPINDDYFLNEQLVNQKPVAHKDMLKLSEESYCQTIYFHLPPDADPAFCKIFMELPCASHISMVVKPLDKKQEMKKSENTTAREKGLASRGGNEARGNKIQDEDNFRQFVENNGLSIFSNGMYLTFFGTEREVRNSVNTAMDIIDSGGQARSTPDTQMAFFRYALPGCGKYALLLRNDHTLQVANMLPAQVFDQGQANPQRLRLSSTGQLVGLSYEPELVNHSFTVAMTGGGKGVNKCAEIIETYPLGIDWYIMEVGTSYQWTVEALGGRYERIDPSETVIQPMPDISIANLDSDGFLSLPLPVITGTIEACTFLLTGGSKQKLDVAEQAAAENALQMVYFMLDAENPEQPILEDLLKALNDEDVPSNESQAVAAKKMAENLENFLDQRAGAIFNQKSNFILSEGITGVDLLLVRNNAKDLMKFYLVFLSLAFTQKAFSSKNRSRVTLDEMHEYVKVAPEIISPLCSGLSRMGRKDGASLDLITQETAEIDAIERAVINSCPWQSLLYRQADWELIADRCNLPKHIVNRWRNYEYPVGKPFRPGIQRYADTYYDFHLTFPEELLLIASSDKSDLDVKAEIGANTKDTFERLKLLKLAQQKRKESKNAA